MTMSSYDGLRIAVRDPYCNADDVYALRYRAYLAEGAIDANDSKRFIDRYDLSRSSVLLCVTQSDGSVAGAIRFAVQPPHSHGIRDFCSAPEFLIFPNQLAWLQQDNRPISSGSRFSIEPNHPQRSAIALLLVCAMARAANAVGAGWGIATARGSHIAFYRRFLEMNPLGMPRRMPGLNYAYALLVADVDLVFQDTQRKLPDACLERFERTSPDFDDLVRDALPYMLRQRVA